MRRIDRYLEHTRLTMSGRVFRQLVLNRTITVIVIFAHVQVDVFLILVVVVIADLAARYACVQIPPIEPL